MAELPLSSTSTAEGEGPFLEQEMAKVAINSEEAGRKGKRKEAPYPCGFREYQELHWRSEIDVDCFDENGVPYSPNPHKMWVRHCLRHERLLQEQDQGKQDTREEGTEDSNSGEDEPRVKVAVSDFKKFKFRPQHGDVVFEDKNGNLISASGTWIINGKDEIVSGPGPVMTALRDGPNLFNPFFPAGRNRCYSDCQNLDNPVSLGIGNDNDSGIDVEADFNLTMTSTSMPSPQEFRPPINSTPNSISPVVRKFHLLNGNANGCEVEKRDPKRRIINNFTGLLREEAVGSENVSGERNDSDES